MSSNQGVRFTGQNQYYPASGYFHGKEVPTHGITAQVNEMKVEKMYPQGIAPQQVPIISQTTANTLANDPYKWGSIQFDAIDAQGNPIGGKLRLRNKSLRKHRDTLMRKKNKRRTTNKRKIKKRKSNSRR